MTILLRPWIPACSIAVLAALSLGSEPSPESAPVRARRPAPMLAADAERSIERGLKFLASKRQPDGAWTATGKEFPTAVTALAGLAFLASGSTPAAGPFRAEVEGAVRFLLDGARANGLIAARDEQRPMYGHGFSMLFLSQALGTGADPATDERIRDVLRKAVELTGACQSKLGGWYYEPNHLQDEGSVTITQVQALRACQNAGVPVPKAVIDRAIGYIDQSRNPDGGLRYQADREGPSRIAITAAGLATLYNAGAYDHPALAPALRFLREKLKPADRTAGHYLYCHFYAAQAFYQAGFADWRRYFPAVRDQILRMQDADGGWSSGVGNSYSTAIALLVLQIPCQYLPIYER